MKKKPSQVRIITVLLSIALVAVLANSALADNRDKGQIFNANNLIKITEDMVYLESSAADPYMLFDEAGTAQFSSSGVITGDCGTAWAANTGYSNTAGKMPYMAYVDLGEVYEIDATAVYHFSASSKLTFSYGMPGDWTAFADYDIAGYKTWRSQMHSSVKTRYIGIAFDMNIGPGNIREILLFGSSAGEGGAEYIHPAPINIEESMITNVDGHVDHSTRYNGRLASPYHWFDEQATLGNQPAATPETGFALGWQTYQGDSVVDIDLYRYYDIEKIYIYDGERSGDFKISAGEYGNWTEIFSYNMRCDDSWIYLDISELCDGVNTRYLRIEKENPVNYIGEIMVYGTPTSQEDRPAAPAPVEVVRPAMGELMGYNAFAWYEAPEYVGAGGNVREYNTASVLFDDRTDGTIRFSQHSRDEYYARYAAAGIEIITCLQGGLKYVAGESVDSKPVSKGDSTTDPASYKEHASLMFQYAARYGSTAVDANLLKVSSGVEAKSGLGLIKYYENWNEQDANWLSENVDGFSAEEYAAMCSADYDGHEGTLGTGYGLKNADPSAQLVMGGTASLYKDYIDGMAHWFKNNRSDGLFAVDVINVHQYNAQSAPEETGLYHEWKGFVDSIHADYPGKEIWLSEFGWDTYIAEDGAKSPTAAPSELAQGQWLVRSYLLGSAAGFDKMQMYMIDDVNSESPGIYNTSGLLKRTGDKERKLSWYYVLTTQEVLKTAVFQEVVRMDDIYVLRYYDSVNGKNIYAVWSPTANGTVYNNYPVSVSGGGSAAAVYLADRSTSGNAQRLNVTNGTVYVNISESPVFITVSDYEVLPPAADLAPDTYHGHQVITLSAEDGAQIYYTLDYSDPVYSGYLYTGPIVLTETATIRAVAVKNGVCSSPSAFPYYLKPLNLRVDDISLVNADMSPVFDGNVYEYFAVVSHDTEYAELIVTAEDYVGVMINGEYQSNPISIALDHGINSITITAVQLQTGQTQTYTLHVTRQYNRHVGVLITQGAGKAEGSEYCPMENAFDGSAWADEYYFVNGDGGSGNFFSIGGRTGYIDFGHNWQDVNIISTWTLYQAYTQSGYSVPLSTMWWDDDVDTVCDSGLYETQLRFAGEQNITNVNYDKWYMDAQYAEPIKPKARYLMITVQDGEAARVRELAMVGYVDGEETETPEQPELPPEIGLITPVSAGKAADGGYTSFENAFDGMVGYDAVNGCPVMFNEGGTPHMFTGRSVCIDLGENWANIRITGTWTYYRQWSNPNGIGLTSMLWNNTGNSGEGVSEERLAFQTASGNLGKDGCWLQDRDLSESPVTPQGRYLIIQVPEGFDSRIAELAITGYVVE